MNIINRIKSLNLPPNQFVVFGSGPMAIHGLRESEDVDLLVTDELYKNLKNLDWKEQASIDGGKRLVNGNFEAYKRWDFGKYSPSPEEIIAVAEFHDDIPFAPLIEVLKWKRASGRPKDLEDIKLIEEYMSKND